LLDILAIRVFREQGDVGMVASLMQIRVSKELFFSINIKFSSRFFILIKFSAKTGNI
jgi:hypothetical protein